MVFHQPIKASYKILNLSHSQVLKLLLEKAQLGNPYLATSLKDSKLLTVFYLLYFMPEQIYFFYIRSHCEG